MTVSCVLGALWRRVAAPCWRRARAGAILGATSDWPVSEQWVADAERVHALLRDALVHGTWIDVHGPSPWPRLRVRVAALGAQNMVLALDHASEPPPIPRANLVWSAQGGVWAMTATLDADALTSGQWCAPVPCMALRQQSRASRRVRVPGRRAAVLTGWHVAEPEVLDLSEGGVGLRVALSPIGVQLPRTPLALTLGDHTVKLPELRVAHARPLPGGMCRLGVSWGELQGLQANVLRRWLNAAEFANRTRFAEPCALQLSATSSTAAL